MIALDGERWHAYNEVHRQISRTFAGSMTLRSKAVTFFRWNLSMEKIIFLLRRIGRLRDRLLR
jgi:hypothetical protein